MFFTSTRARRGAWPLSRARKCLSCWTRHIYMQSWLIKRCVCGVQYARFVLHWTDWPMATITDALWFDCVWGWGCSIGLADALNVDFMWNAAYTDGANYSLLTFDQQNNVIGGVSRWSGWYGKVVIVHNNIPNIHGNFSKKHWCLLWWIFHNICRTISASKSVDVVIINPWIYCLLT